jgi:hypothetical protein
MRTANVARILREMEAKHIERASEEAERYWFIEKKK